MNVLFYAAVAFGLLLVKTTILLPWPALVRLFDPILIMTVYLGLFRPGLSYAAVVVFFGYLADTFSGSRFGFHIIIVTGIYYLTLLLRGRFFLDSRFFQGVYVAAMVLVHALIGMFIFWLIGSETQASYLFDEVVRRMLFNAPLGVLLFRWLRKTESAWAPLSERKPSGISLE